MRISRFGVAGIAAIAASTLVVSACATPYESEVIEGTEITVAWNDLINEFNPNSASGNNTANAIVTYMTSSGFNYYNSDPALIDDTGFGTYEKTSDDPLTVEYTINDGVVWSDGVDIDAADLLLAWVTIFAGVTDADGNPLFLHANPRAELATATPEIDGRKLTLVYDIAYVDWPTQFGLGVSAHGTVQMAYPEIEDAGEAKRLLIEAIQEKDVEWLTPVAEAWNTGYQSPNTPENPLVTLSSGQYVVEELVEDSYVTLVANERYTWGPSPKYERITVREISDPTAAVQAVDNGDVQVASGQPTPDVLQLVQALSNGEYATGDEATYEHVDLTFNNGGPFDPAAYDGDAETAKLVRQAFLSVIPRQQIIDTLIAPLNPNAEIRNSILLIPGSPGYDDMVAQNGSAFYSESGTEAGIAQARDLLAQAGVETPVDVRFWYPEGNVRRAAEFELIAQAGAQAGFNVIDTSEPNWEFTDPSINPVNPHDAVIFAWQSTSLAVTGSDQFLGTGQPSNFGGYSNTEVDRLLKSLETELDEARQIEIQIEVEKLLWEDAYGTTIFQFPGLTWWDAGVEGIDPSPLSPTYFWNFWEWAPVGAVAQ
ncbi:MAG: ABC transporter family substrate-binding protein [Microcella sp.]|uniref:ABC transporter family substrate-binding protein n=1 Tax=Microcella sp. TaxID=1913979 RepID=UPI0024CC474C|nr:ABC transporter family substrate-binding protein [Microcella sp.]UYN83760.1 MAG: ABC transporter family substrate-binding protein [Microcella sp.]